VAPAYSRRVAHINTSELLNTHNSPTPHLLTRKYCPPPASSHTQRNYPSQPSSCHSHGIENSLMAIRMIILIPDRFLSLGAKPLRLFLAHPKNPRERHHAVRTEHGLRAQQHHRANTLESLILWPRAERLVIDLDLHVDEACVLEVLFHRWAVCGCWAPTLYHCLGESVQVDLDRVIGFHRAVVTAERTADFLKLDVPARLCAAG